MRRRRRSRSSRRRTAIRRMRRTTRRRRSSRSSRRRTERRRRRRTTTRRTRTRSRRTSSDGGSAVAAALSSLAPLPLLVRRPRVGVRVAVRHPSAARGKGQGGRRRPTHQSLQGVDKAGTAIFYFTTLTNIKQLPPAVKQTNLSAAAVAPFPPLVHRPRVDVRVAVRRLFVCRRAIRRARGGTRRTPPS